MPLRWREGIEGGAAHDSFLAAVFAMAPPQRAMPPPWHGFGLFDGEGRCVAAAEVATLPLLLAGTTHRVRCLRLVGVRPERRGEGLFRRLMRRVMRLGGPMLLFAAEATLYERFGFATVRECAFEGAAPAAVAAPPARRLDPRSDAALIRRLLLSRQPVSGEAALVGAPELFLDRLAADPGLALAHLPAPDALLAYGEDGDALVVADVAAAAMPTLPAVLGALPRRYAAVRALFPPDRLGWRGAPVADGTGLMLAGTLPLPPSFRLPPTAEF